MVGASRNCGRPGAAQYSASRERHPSPSHKGSAAWKVAESQEPGHPDSQKPTPSEAFIDRWWYSYNQLMALAYKQTPYMQFSSFLPFIVKEESLEYVDKNQGKKCVKINHHYCSWLLYIHHAHLHSTANEQSYTWTNTRQQCPTWNVHESIHKT